MNIPAQENHYQLANRGARFGAALVDLAIMIACFLPGIFVLSSSYTDWGRGIGTTLIILAWLGLLVVQTTLLIKQGQSLGKMAVGIKIVRMSDEGVPGFVKVVLLRSWVPSILYGIPYLGFAVMLVDFLLVFRDDRRCLHDLIAETKVVNADTENQTALNPASTMQQPASTNETGTAPAEFCDDPLFEIVANEMETGKTDKGLWTRLLAECDGDEQKTRIAYIKQRARKLALSEATRIE